jgi:hypothetical protein
MEGFPRKPCQPPGVSERLDFIGLTGWRWLIQPVRPRQRVLREGAYVTAFTL